MKDAIIGLWNDLVGPIIRWWRDWRASARERKRRIKEAECRRRREGRP